MPNLNRVDDAHAQLHVDNTALDEAIAAEQQAQAAVNDLEAQLAQANAALTAATSAREQAEQQYNGSCDNLANESIAAKVEAPTPQATFKRRT